MLAFNGLMETQQGLPNDFDQQLWQDCESAIGAKTNALLTPDEISKIMPRRPAWLRAEDGIDRRALFAKLKGVMTYGSPLEKFAALQPAVVPLNRDEAVFPAGFEWSNVFDATDPVADRLKSFEPKCSGAMPRNLSYKAKWVHLLSHINYLTFKAGEDNRLVNAVASWLLAAHIEFIALAGRDPDRRLRRCTLPDLDRRRSGVGSHFGAVGRLGAPHPSRKPARMDVRWRGRLRKRLRLADKRSSRRTAAIVGPHPSRRPVRAGVCGQGCALHPRPGVGRPHRGSAECCGIGSAVEPTTRDRSCPGASGEGDALEPPPSDSLATLQ